MNREKGRYFTQLSAESRVCGTALSETGLVMWKGVGGGGVDRKPWEYSKWAVEQQDQHCVTEELKEIN